MVAELEGSNMCSNEHGCGGCGGDGCGGSTKNAGGKAPPSRIALEAAPSADLLSELERRGVFTQLHGAVGALYDHLGRTGVLDSDSYMTQYLAYRLRREAARIDSASPGTVSFWQDKIKALEATAG